MLHHPQVAILQLNLVEGRQRSLFIWVDSWVKSETLMDLTKITFTH